MNREVRVRPWQLAVLSIAGGAIGALIFAVTIPARLESQMEVEMPSFASLAQQVMPAVVNINTSKTIAAGPRRPFPRGQDPFEQFFGEDFWQRFGGRRGPQKQRSLGSGFVIDNAGYIVTNRHVVNGADDIDVQFSNGKAYKAKLVGEDTKTDVAVLKIKPEGRLPTVPLGDSSKLQVGDWVIAVGNPFGLEHTVTAGIVSARDRVIGAGPYDDFIQTDAPINPGNSGGPLLDASGRVIGINSQIYTGSGGGGSVGIGFAVPIDKAKTELAQLEKGGTVSGAYIGLTSLTIDGSLTALNLPVKSGALVQSVQKGTPAERAGIKGGNLSGNTEGGQVAVGGDIITAVDGKKVGSSEDLANIIQAHKPGQTVTISLMRARGGGSYERKDVKVTLTSRPSSVPNPNTPE
jgi:Do/DeqQ family serine protease